MTTAETNKMIAGKSMWLAVLVTWLFFLLSGLMFPAQAISTDQAVEQCITTKTGNIIIASDSNGSVMLTEGRITASVGESIKLLPGTHLKGDDPLTVSIVSTEYQEALAEEAAGEEKKQAVESILKRREAAPTLVEASFMIRAFGGSGSRNYLSKQEYLSAMLPVRTHTSVSETATANQQKHSSTADNQVHSLCNFADLYQPVMSWGALAETIAVMLA